MKLIDWFAAIILFLLGCVHNFIAAPATYDSLNTTAMWFVSGGVMLWYAAIINFFWLRAGAGDRTAARLAATSNIVLLGFAVLFVYAKQSWADPQNILLLAPAFWLSARSIRASF
ncbi:MAG: hypothetical protein ACE5FO_07735 [Parvularculaceae bacterium]